ncbi:MAG: alpha/beta hydrolase-fold protein [Verrucomicrobiota bacterium]
MKFVPLAAFTIAFAVSAAADNPDSKFPRSVEVHDDRTVTFRFIAPNASSVEVRGQAVGGKKALSKGDNGLWSATVGPVESGLYDYSFNIDGAAVLDPHNRWVKGWRRSANMFEIPGDPSHLWETQATPHGEVHQLLDHSDTLETARRTFVYTPPGYHESDADFPVLFLLHGSGDDASAWTNVGRAHLIADNLIAQGKMKPMVIVMPHGHANLPGVDPYEIESSDEWRRQNFEAVHDDFFDRLLPLIAKRYRVRNDPEGRAIAGLSMGGGQALRFGLNRPDEFGWVAGFSSGIAGDDETAGEHFAQMPAAAEFKLVWLGCGKDDFLIERNEFFHEWLTKKNVEHAWRLTEGGHSWPVWREYLAELLPQLFSK